MHPKITPIKKETHLPNLLFAGFHLNFPECTKISNILPAQVQEIQIGKKIAHVKSGLGQVWASIFW